MPQLPVRVGCVDAGSNAIRCVVEDFNGGLRGDPVHYERVPIRLGQGVFDEGRLSPDTIDSCVEAFVEFAQQIQTLGVHAFRAVTTSAVREASNGSVLRDRIRNETGIDLHVISAVEEARLIHRAVASRVELSDRPWIIVDLGGGSLEISLADESRVLSTESYGIGSVRLLSILGPDRERRSSINELLEATLGPSILLDQPEGAGFIATGGNIHALADLAGAPVAATGGRTLSLAKLTAVTEQLSRLSTAERITRVVMENNRADVIVPAAWVYHRLAELAGTTEIRVPGVGLKDGVLLDLLDAAGYRGA